MAIPSAGYLPGIQWQGVVAPELQAAVISWNPASLSAFTETPEEYIRHADIGSRVTPGLFEARTPQRLVGSMRYTEFDGSREYNRVTIASPIVKTNPKTLNFDWPLILERATGAVRVGDYYGLGDIVSECAGAARVHKAELWVRAIELGIGSGAVVRTPEQPGYTSGLPLFSDASTGLHFANSKNRNSGRFANLFRNVGKLDSGDVFQDTLDHMIAVPHASFDGLPMGCSVRHWIGPTWMRKTFFKLFVANLILEAGKGAAAGAVAAVTNLAREQILGNYNETNFVGVQAGGMKFHLAPFLDRLDYFTANSNAKGSPTLGGSGEQMWITVDDSPRRPPAIEFVSPDVNLIPTAHLFGDQDPQSIAEMRARLLTDLHVGFGGGQPHAMQIHWEGAGPT
jgi:hypothetical protein